MYDIGDEIAAYKRQTIFDDETLPEELMSGITSENIRLIKSDGMAPYAQLPDESLELLAPNTPKKTAEGAMQVILKTFNHAFRYNYKTYYPETK